MTFSRTLLALALTSALAGTLEAAPANSAAATTTSLRAFVLNPAYLASARQRLQSGDASLTPALQRLERDAADALKAGPFSVMRKELLPPSGDKHDYFSQAPYFWTNPASSNGLPYVRRDGVRNPEINKITDHGQLSRMCESVETLALAYYFTGNEAYAEKAAQLLRAWFLDSATRMNPNLNYAQGIPGSTSGRGFGLIETRGFTQVIDGIGLLAGSKAWTRADQDGLERWFSQFLGWMLESKNGKEEAGSKNNHGTYYDVQVVSMALFVGRNELATNVLRSAEQKRIAIQIEPDGRQPLELARTRSWSYSVANLSGLMLLADLGERLHVDLWHYETADGRSLRKALAYLAPYALGQAQWPHQQIGGFSRSALYPLLRRAAVEDPIPPHQTWAAQLPSLDPADRARLLRPLPGPDNKNAGAVSEVTIAIDPKAAGQALPNDFVGLSFEMEKLLPDANGQHFFRPENQRLIQIFRTLGIRNLRVGGNTADRPGVRVPSEADADQLFAFAHAAGVKVIYTLRLREGSRDGAVTVARHIMAHHRADLACFAIGNEPNVFAREYSAYRDEWQNYVRAITDPACAPGAKFCGPSATPGKTAWARDFIRDFGAGGDVAFISQHDYPGGNARTATNVVAARALMLSTNWVNHYARFHGQFAAAALSNGLPFRLEEANSFYNGGAKDVSDTFASALWGLDYLHWWAAHGAGGINFHTGDRVAAGEQNTPCRYAAFWSTDNGYEVHPIGYGIKAFDVGGRGSLVPATLVQNASQLNLTAYARLADHSVFLTVINKENGSNARDAAVKLGSSSPLNDAKAMVLTGPDLAATSGVTLGGSAIREDGQWNGAWSDLPAPGQPAAWTLAVPAGTAVVIRFSTGR